MSLDPPAPEGGRAKRLAAYGSVLSLGIAAVLLGSWWAVQWLSADAVREAEMFLDHVRRGDMEAAYEAGAPQLRERTPLSEFTETLSSLVGHSSRTWTRRTVDDAGARLQGTILGADGESRSLTITQIRDGDRWPVARLRLRD